MKKRHSEEQILGILKEKGSRDRQPLRALLRQHAISGGTFYRRESRYGGLEPSQLHELKQLELETRI